MSRCDDSKLCSYRAPLVGDATSAALLPILRLGMNEQECERVSALLLGSDDRALFFEVEWTERGAGALGSGALGSRGRLGKPTPSSHADVR